MLFKQTKNTKFVDFQDNFKTNSIFFPWLWWKLEKTKNVQNWSCSCVCFPFTTINLFTPFSFRLPVPGRIYFSKQCQLEIETFFIFFIIICHNFQIGLERVTFWNILEHFLLSKANRRWRQSLTKKQNKAKNKFFLLYLRRFSSIFFSGFSCSKQNPGEKRKETEGEGEGRNKKRSRSWCLEWFFCLSANATQ